MSGLSSGPTFLSVTPDGTTSGFGPNFRGSMENLHQFFFTVSSHTGPSAAALLIPLRVQAAGMNQGPIRRLPRMLHGMMGKGLNMREVSRASKMIHIIKEHERKKRKRDRLKRGNVCIMSEAL
ncbi:hypothetical protein INR49_011935 [Caranx melampygus]|nr:hypothetical protein INR49_011935 [Caranx melampygus]